LNAAFKSYESGGGAAEARITGHGSVPGAQQHQKPDPGQAASPAQASQHLRANDTNAASTP
jgi:hypothetical protein